jgi:hypothetical protein
MPSVNRSKKVLLPAALLLLSLLVWAGAALTLSANNPPSATPSVPQGDSVIIRGTATGQVINEQLGNGMAVFSLTGAGSLQGRHAAEALQRAVENPGIDDTFLTVSFNLEPPGAFIDPIGDYAV